MALADYYLCDVCERKTFYDGNVPYGEYQEGVQQNPKTGHPWPDGNVGDMAVLCRECAKTHKITITPNPSRQGTRLVPRTLDGVVGSRKNKKG